MRKSQIIDQSGRAYLGKENRGKYFHLEFEDNKSCELIAVESIELSSLSDHEQRIIEKSLAERPVDKEKSLLRRVTNDGRITINKKFAGEHYSLIKTKTGFSLELIVYKQAASA